MSVRVMGVVWELDIEPRQKLVLLALADHADHNGNNVHPSVDLVAWKTGFSPRNVQRIMRELEAAGILVVVGGRKGGRGYAAHYRIDTEKGDRLPPFVRGNGDSIAPFAPEKGDNMSPIERERVTNSTVKGDTGVTRTVNEPSTDDVVGAREEPQTPTPPYRDLLNGKYDRMRDAFCRLRPEEFTPSWFDRTLVEAQFQVQPEVGELSAKQIAAGLRSAHKGIEGALKGDIHYPRQYAKRLILDRLTEQGS